MPQVQRGRGVGELTVGDGILSCGAFALGGFLTGGLFPGFFTRYPKFYIRFLFPSFFVVSISQDGRI